MFRNFSCLCRKRWLSVGFATLPKHTLIKFPELPDKSPFGKIDKWLVQVGQRIEAGSEVVSIETAQFSIVLAAESDGFLAKKMYDDGSDDIPVNSSIGILVDEIAGLNAFSAPTKVAGSIPSHASSHETTLAMLKMIKKMMSDGKVSDLEFCRKLLALSRKEALNDELTAVFESSFTGDMKDDKNFDADFFLMNAKDIVKNMKDDGNSTDTLSK